MPDAHTRAENFIGAFALALADRTAAAVEEAAGVGGALPSALVALGQVDGPMAIERLAQSMGVTHSRAVRIVDRLEADRLVSRRRDEDDRRIVRVALTARGRHSRERIVAARTSVLAEFLSPLGERQLHTLGTLAASALAASIGGRTDARRTCRLCDSVACGHHAGRCPVTRAADDAEAVG